MNPYRDGKFRRPKFIRVDNDLVLALDDILAVHLFDEKDKDNYWGKIYTRTQNWRIGKKSVLEDLIRNLPEVDLAAETT